MVRSAALRTACDFESDSQMDGWRIWAAEAYLKITSNDEDIYTIPAANSASFADAFVDGIEGPVALDMVSY